MCRSNCSWWRDFLTGRGDWLVIPSEICHPERSEGSGCFRDRDPSPAAQDDEALAQAAAEASAVCWPNLASIRTENSFAALSAGPSFSESPTTSSNKRRRWRPNGRTTITPRRQPSTSQRASSRLCSLAAVCASAISDASIALLRSSGFGSACSWVATSSPSSEATAASFAVGSLLHNAANSCCMPMRESRGSSAIVRSLQAGEQHVEQQQRVFLAADVDFHHRNREAFGLERVLISIDAGLRVQVAAANADDTIAGRNPRCKFAHVLDREFDRVRAPVVGEDDGTDRILGNHRPHEIEAGLPWCAVELHQVVVVCLPTASASTLATSVLIGGMSDSAWIAVVFRHLSGRQIRCGTVPYPAT